MKEVEVSMFTGIVSDIGTVRSIISEGDTRIEIVCSLPLEKLTVGASIAHEGVCLTVIEKGKDWYAVQVSAETLSKTTLGQWNVGTRINLEPALKIGDELGGHIVSGHVDGVATLLEKHIEGESLRMVFAVSDELSRFIAPKGSVTLGGVSLTVNEVNGNRFGINLIPHTQNVTTLGKLAVGDRINLEIDMLARYVARLLEKE